MFGTDPITGFFGKVKQIIPTYLQPKTNVNPNYRNGTMPRLRYDKRKGPRKLRLPANLYSQKEVATQQTAVSNYHQRQRFQKEQRQLANETKKLNRHIAIQERKDFKTNQPVIEV
jgi:hypothetical protein